jgi:hypothetical protein
VSNLLRAIDPWGEVTCLPFSAFDACGHCDGPCSFVPPTKTEPATLVCRDNTYCRARGSISERAHAGKPVRFVDWGVAV